MYKKIENYFKQHPTYNSIVHILAGMGIGVLITYPIVGTHPLRWGLVLLVLGVLGHLYPLYFKK